ncbi:NACHT domain-containing protein [Geodermatophilus tzadiensis]|uniref:NACHT domain-containing protein n=1 Tax=Geodermatophilus tzadiensis TaxID=1137988 RepID=A0A2T0TRU8_9ACTN|nr:NACHT domain-containing protein [Geodermatophilus tzadiensis]PRY48379.1 NACHT domain-containing protein [Geodermatophilus tzadiensis]
MVLSALLTLILLTWVLRGIIVVTFFNKKDVAWSWRDFNPDLGCQDVPTSCAAITGVLMPVLFLAWTTVLFLFWRQRRVLRYYAHRAKTEPYRLVQTAGSLTDEVIGRDQLCDALINNLRDAKARRPHVVVGSVGVGKTAVLVHLTARLAAKGAVPVPIRMRDVQDEGHLDFCELARVRFTQIVQPVVRSSAEQDRIWRWLRQRAGRVVVVADGLEEALADETMAGQRDNLIRTAIRNADDEGLPLVIASRPHDPLRAMQAAITDLEPLSEEAAMRYIAAGGSWRSEAVLLDRVVEAAKMGESPLYMRLARDLHRQDLLEPLWLEVGGLDVVMLDRWSFRQDLLQAWLDALVDGKIHPELPIDQRTRKAVIEYLSALACIGLRSDSATVALRDLDPFLTAGSAAQPDTEARPDDSGRAWNRSVAAYVDDRIKRLQQATNDRLDVVGAGVVQSPWMDVRLAATWGTRMGLVREYGRSAHGPAGGGTVANATVHFQHSIIQAFLGSRALRGVLGEVRSPVPSGGGTVSESLAERRRMVSAALDRCGRELLIAFVLNSRSLDGRCNCVGPDDVPTDGCPTRLVRDALQNKTLRLLEEATALQDVLKRQARQEREERRRIGEAAGEVFRHGLRLWALEVFGACVEIASVEAGPGLADLVHLAESHWEQFGAGEDPVRLREEKLTVVEQCGAAASRIGSDNDGRGTYRKLFEIGCAEPDYRVRLAIAQRIGTGGERAFSAVYDVIHQHEIVVKGDRPKRPPAEELTTTPGQLDPRMYRAWCSRHQRAMQRRERELADTEAEEERRRWYAETMRAWVLPMLVDSAKLTRHSGSPWDDLENWIVDATKANEPRNGRLLSPGERCDLGVALAQGFKYAANRRPGPHSNQESREFLVKQAQELLKRSSYWYTRLTLVQALTLWALPDDVSAPQAIRGHGADPAGQVREWLKLERDRREHPLVQEAGKLAVRALQTRRPERFLWVDDGAVASQLGTEAGFSARPRFHNLWIHPSTGWTSLDFKAQQLLADALLLLVLGERGYRPKDLFRFLERVTSDESRLPSCLTRDRTRLDPVRAVESAVTPGEFCRDDCGLRMCPYPAKAEKYIRLEFNELFCLHQRELLRTWQPRSWLNFRFRRKATWQRRVPVAGMRRFWDQMGERARDVDPDHVRVSGRNAHR